MAVFLLQFCSTHPTTDTGVGILRGRAIPLPYLWRAQDAYTSSTLHNSRV